MQSTKHLWVEYLGINIVLESYLLLIFFFLAAQVTDGFELALTPFVIPWGAVSYPSALAQ